MTVVLVSLQALILPYFFIACDRDGSQTGAF